MNLILFVVWMLLFPLVCDIRCWLGEKYYPSATPGARAGEALFNLAIFLLVGIVLLIKGI